MSGSPSFRWCSAAAMNSRRRDGDGALTSQEMELMTVAGEERPQYAHPSGVRSLNPARRSCAGGTNFLARRSSS